MRALDLFCGAGGCSVGYSRAGFEVVGVDLEPMKDYPFEFHKGDAVEFVLKHGHEFDLIHASPPCQAHSAMQHIHKNPNDHPRLIEPTRDALIAIGKPYVIENVVGSPLFSPVTLCGTMFGLRIIRHRLFEMSFPVDVLLPPCNHSDVYDPWHGKVGERSAERFRKAMGIDWMTDAGGGRRKGTLGLAIPPAYTEWIGRKAIEAIQ